MASTIEPDKCYLCHGIATSDEQFATDPCSCTGTNKVHMACLKTIRNRGATKCSICKEPYNQVKLSAAQLQEYRKKAGNDPPPPPFYLGGVPFNGVHTTYYKSGSPYEEKTYVAGILNGQYRTYYPNGALELDLYYVDGMQEGVNRMYYRTGELYFEASVLNSLRHGRMIYYYPNGKPKIECVYKYGALQMPFNTYDEHGNIKLLTG